MRNLPSCFQNLPGGGGLVLTWINLHKAPVLCLPFGMGEAIPCPADTGEMIVSCNPNNGVTKPKVQEKSPPWKEICMLDLEFQWDGWGACADYSLGQEWWRIYKSWAPSQSSPAWTQAMSPERSTERDFSANSLLIILHRMSNTGINLETSTRPKFLCPSWQGQGSRAWADLSLPSPFLPESIGAGFSLGLCQPKPGLQDKELCPQQTHFMLTQSMPPWLCLGVVWWQLFRWHSSFSRMWAKKSHVWWFCKYQIHSQKVLYRKYRSVVPGLCLSWLLLPKSHPGMGWEGRKRQWGLQRHCLELKWIVRMVSQESWGCWRDCVCFRFRAEEGLKERVMGL